MKKEQGISVWAGSVLIGFVSLFAFAGETPLQNRVDLFGIPAQDATTSAAGDQVVDVHVLESPEQHGVRAFGLVRLQNTLAASPSDDPLNLEFTAVSVQPGIGAGIHIAELDPGWLTVRWAVTSGSWYVLGDRSFRPAVTFSQRLEWAF